MADLRRFAKKHRKRLVFASGPGGAMLELALHVDHERVHDDVPGRITHGNDGKPLLLEELRAAADRAQLAYRITVDSPRTLRAVKQGTRLTQVRLAPGRRERIGSSSLPRRMEMRGCGLSPSCGQSEDEQTISPVSLLTEQSPLSSTTVTSALSPPPPMCPIENPPELGSVAWGVTLSSSSALSTDRDDHATSESAPREAIPVRTDASGGGALRGGPGRSGACGIRRGSRCVSRHPPTRDVVNAGRPRA